MWPCTRCVPTRSNAGGSPQTNPAAHPGRTPRPDPAGRLARAYGSEGQRGRLLAFLLAQAMTTRADTPSVTFGPGWSSVAPIARPSRGRIRPTPGVVVHASGRTRPDSPELSAAVRSAWAYKADVDGFEPSAPTHLSSGCRRAHRSAVRYAIRTVLTPTAAARDGRVSPTSPVRGAIDAPRLQTSPVPPSVPSTRRQRAT